MPISAVLNKEQVSRIVSNIRVNVTLDANYINDVYLMANEAIDLLKDNTRSIEVKEINQFDLLLYCIGEYCYSISNLKEENLFFLSLCSFLTIYIALLFAPINGFTFPIFFLPPEVLE